MWRRTESIFSASVLKDPWGNGVPFPGVLCFPRASSRSSLRPIIPGMSIRPIIIGVAGGSGSGKTTVVRELIRGLGKRQVSVIHHDSYYRAVDLPFDERAKINYDHPNSLETSLLVAHLETLLEGDAVEIPIYDFADHKRVAETETIEPKKVIIVDGLMVLWDVSLRSLMDIKIFVDTDSDVRFIRRLTRDIQDRGRSVDSVIEQYSRTVRPMHLEFVEPSKRYADVIIPEGGHNRVAVQMLMTTIRDILGEPVQ